MSVNPIKGKFIKISNEEAFKGAKQDGSDKEILKVSSSDKVVLLDLPIVDDGVNPASNVATEAYVDGEISSVNGRIDDHVAGIAENHAAADIVVTPQGNLSSVNAQSALQELQGDIDSINTTISGLSFSADAISVVPAGNISSTDVQAALQELDSEKVKKSGDSMQGNLTMESASITVDFSQGVVTDQVTLQQGEITIQNSSTNAYDLSTSVSPSSAAFSNQDYSSGNNSTLNLGATTAGALVSGYQATADWSGGVSIGSGGVGFNYLDGVQNTSSQATYSVSSFGISKTDNVSGQSIVINADASSGIVSAFLNAGSGPEAIMPSNQWELTPKKYVDDADAAQATALSDHLNDAVDAHDASAISFAPAGNIAATDVQSALQELDSEKVKKSGDTMSGLLDITKAGEIGLEVNNVVIGEPWGPGYSVVSAKDGSTDEMYIQSADQLGSFAGNASKLMAIASGYSQGANSGPILITSGDAAVSGDSGQITIHSGGVASGNTGSVTLASSAVVSGNGTSGQLFVGSGAIINASSSAASGNTNIATGSSSGLGSTGIAQIQSGVISNASSSADTGFAQIRSGNNAGSGSSGVVYVASGNNTGAGNSGDISLFTGSVNSGARGKISLNSSLAEVYSQLDMKSHKIISLSAGSASGDAVEYSQMNSALALKADKDLSNLVVSPFGAYEFKSNLNFINGWNEVKSKDATGSSNSGGMGFKSGDADSGNSGILAIGSGNSASGLAGDVYLFSGVGASGRGMIQVEASKLNLLNEIDMNSYQIKELADGTLSSDAVNKGQLDDGLALKLSLSGGTMSGGIDMQNNTITHLTMTSDADSAATKAYVDSVAEGLHVHAPARAIRSVAIAGTYSNGTAGVGAKITPSSPISNIDGLSSFAVGQRIIVNGQSNSWENGIYTVSAIDGSNHITELTRATDFDTPTEVAGGDFIFVQEGSTYADTGWVETKTTTAPGFGVSDPIQFLQFSGAGSYQAGDGLNLDGTLFSVDVADLVGFGIGHDGSNNFRISSEAAGDGISGGDGVALAVDHDSLGLTFVGGQLSLAIDPSMLDKSSGDLKLADTTVTSGTYGSASKTPSFNVDAQGRLTLAQEQDISITASQVSDFTSAAQSSISVNDTSTVDLSYASGVISADIKYDNASMEVGANGLKVSFDSTLKDGATGLGLADTSVSAGSYASSASKTASFTVDAQGRLTAAAEQDISITASQVSDFTSAAQASISVADSFSMDFGYSAGSITADLRLDSSNLALSVSPAGLKLADTSVSAGSYASSASKTASFTVDAQGRLTAAAEQDISITASQVSDFQSAVRSEISVSDSNSIDLTYSSGQVSADVRLADSSLSISSSGLKVENRFHKETYLITSAQSSGAYYDLSFEVEPSSLMVFVDRLALHEGSSGDGISDFYLSTVGGVTRVNFQGAVVAAGQQQLSNGDRLFFSYQKKAA